MTDRGGHFISFFFFFFSLSKATLLCSLNSQTLMDDRTPPWAFYNDNKHITVYVFRMKIVRVRRCFRATTVTPKTILADTTPLKRTTTDTQIYYQIHHPMEPHP